jgi:3',5'-cyclic AMP phosphodiesterase CpdA
MRLVAAFCCLLLFSPAGNRGAHGQASNAPVIIIQLSDIHLGEARAPHAAENLRRAVKMSNTRHADAVVITGDIGDKAEDWEQARAILNELDCPLYYVPGNHDVHTKDVARYRAAFGADYYRFRVKKVDLIVIDSELLGNYDKYEANSPLPLPWETEQEASKMLHWLEALAAHATDTITIGLQHIPDARDGDFPPDTKPYWVISEPYRSREIDLLHRLRIRHMLVGHWHYGRVFEYQGITWHVAPATSWLPWGGELGFAINTITREGSVNTEFVNLPGAQP